MLHLLDSYIGKGKSVAGGQEVQYRCPFCHSASNHFYINYSSGKFCCHSARCGKRGTLSSLVKRLCLDPSVINLTTPSLLSLYYRLYGVKEEDYSTNISIKDPGNLTLIQPSMLAYDYLISRGLTYKDIIKNNLCLSDKDNFTRIYFTEVNKNNRIIFWVARNYLPNKNFGPKYLNASNTKRTNIFRINDIDPAKPIHITEGPISAIIADDNAVATYGVEVTKDQIEVLASLNAPLYYCSLDGEAFKYSSRLAKNLRALGRKTNLVPMPLGEDPASLGRKEYSKCVLKSIPLDSSDFYLLHERLQRLW